MKAGTVLSIVIVIVALFGVLLILHPRLEFVDLVAIIVLAMAEIAFDIAEKGHKAPAVPKPQDESLGRRART